MEGNHRRNLLLVVLVLVSGIAVYRPGLNGPFLFDDHYQIADNPAIAISELSLEQLREAALAGHARAYVSRPIPRLSFALNYHFAGQRFDTGAFKLTNLGIHLANGLLVFLLARLLCERMRLSPQKSGSYADPLWSWFPVLVAAAWTLHPIQLTSVLYTVQRMTSMAGFFVLFGLVVFVLGRQRLADGRPWGLTMMTGGVGLGTVLGALCKENAVLMPFFAFVVESFFFNRLGMTARAKRRLLSFYFLTVALPVIAAIYLLLFNWDYVEGTYAIRNFTPYERVLTECRVLFVYLGLMLFPNIRSFSLFHDDIPISQGMLDPLTTLPSLIGIAVIAIGSIWGIRRQSMLAFAFLWFLVGHAIESTILGLEIAHEHRNYLSSLGIVFGGIYFLTSQFERFPTVKKLALPLLVSLIGVIGLVTYSRATIWDSHESVAYAMTRNHPDSFRAWLSLGVAKERKASDVRVIYDVYRRAAAVNPYSVHPVTKMQRIVSGLIFHLSNGSFAEDLDTPIPDVGSLYDHKLIFHLNYLKRLDSLIAEEISHRLRNYATDAQTLSALRELVRCALGKTDTCPPPKRVLDWVLVNLENTRLTARQRGGLQYFAARLYYYLGNSDKAVEYAALSVKSDPDLLELLNQVADLYLLLGLEEDAEAIIIKLQKQSKGNPRYEELARLLSRRLHELRSGSPGAKEKSEIEGLE